MSTTAPIPWDCHAHHRRSRMQVHRLHYLGIGLCQAASQLLGQYREPGTSTNHFSLSWDIFNWGKTCFIIWLIEREEGTFKTCNTVSYSPNEENSLKSREVGRFSHLPHRASLLSPSEQPHWIPRSILKQPEGKLFANNAAGCEYWPRPSSYPRGWPHPQYSPEGATVPLWSQLHIYPLAKQILEPRWWGWNVKIAV